MILGRAAGNGDLAAAERLVALLRRERGTSLDPHVRIRDLPEDAFGSFKSRKVRLLNALRDLRVPKRPDLRAETLLDLSQFTEARLSRRRGMGAVLVETLRDLLGRAGLDFAAEEQDEGETAEVDLHQVKDRKLVVRVGASSVTLSAGERNTAVFDAGRAGAWEIFVSEGDRVRQLQ